MSFFLQVMETRMACLLSFLETMAATQLQSAWIDLRNSGRLYWHAQVSHWMRKFSCLLECCLSRSRITPLMLLSYITYLIFTHSSWKSVNFELLKFGSIYYCSARWIGNHGFSIGIDDVAPSDRLNREKEKKIIKGYSACDQHIQAYKKGKLELQPGCNAAQTLESAVMGELNQIREAAGNVERLPTVFLVA